MIQLNLLPDVKLEYIKAQRMRRLIASVSFIATTAAVVLLVALFLYDGLQGKNLSNINKDIGTATTKLQKEPQIDRVLTVQSQLQSLTSLHDGKPAASRLSTYLNEVTPVQVTISSLSIDFNAHTISITGASDNLKDVNTYVDTLKFTTYSITGQKGSLPAFSNVVLSTFGLDSQTQNPSQAANYTLTLSFDPAIFNITKDINLTVPSIVTTRSEQGQPTDLFKASPTGSSTSKSGGQ